jgi:microcystin-dependent protein
MSMVITDNSPSAGYVAWTGVIMTLKSVDYTISNANSNKKYIWWDFTNPNVMQESDTLPTLADDDCVFILNKSGTHYLIPNATIYRSELFANNPIGAMMDFAGVTPPEGYLLCDGTAVSRTTYADLFGVCGVLYGVGDGSTTFNLPNCKGKVSVGYDSTQTEFDTLGETGGEKTHVLDTTEMPAHSHGVAAFNGGASDTSKIGRSDGTGYQITPITESTGGGLAHQNLQPYITFNKIIKY